MIENAAKSVLRFRRAARIPLKLYFALSDFQEEGASQTGLVLITRLKELFNSVAFVDHNSP
jgi:hypothetical protein